jgi:hypothetical protein
VPNALELEGGSRAFSGSMHGEKLEAGGTARPTWSAAATILGHHAMETRPIFTRQDHGPTASGRDRQEL